MKLLDPVLLAKFSNFRIHIKQVVEGILSGLHSSKLKGQSLEFAEHREYSFGDELKYIDWKVYGRSDKFFVKQFQDETNLRAYVLQDASKSMAYKSQNYPSKLEYASVLSAVISYLLIMQEDAVSLSIFDDNLRFFLPLSSNVSHLSIIVNELEKTTPSNKTDIDKALQTLGVHLKKRGLVIIISDLLGDEERIMKAIKYFKYRHHQVIVMHILDPNEINFDFRGEYTFKDLEENSKIYFDTDIVKQEYKKVFQKMLDEYKISFRQAGVEYYQFTTDIPPEIALGNSLFKKA